MRDLQKDLELCEKATPGPWKVVSGKSFGVQSENKNIASCFRAENEQFIAAARTGWPEAIQRAIAAEARVKELEDELSDCKAMNSADQKVIDFLNQQIEQMRCCGNCAHNNLNFDEEYDICLNECKNLSHWQPKEKAR